MSGDAADSAQPAVAEQNPYAWVMVAVAFGLQTLAFGGVGSVGVFLKPLTAEFGWSRGEASAGYTALALSAALFGIIWGWLADRKGARNIALFGVLMMGISFFALSLTGALWYYYLMYFAFGALGNSAVGTPIYATVGYWFSRNQGLAIGVMAAGGAFGQAVVPFAARLLISAWDWQTAYATIGIGFLVLGIPLALLVRDPPTRTVAVGAGGTPSPAAEPDPPAPPRIVIPFLSSAAFFCCFCMAVPIVHTVALVSDRGIAPEAAASVLLVLMIAGIGGRILGGRLADMVGPVNGWMLMSFGQTVLVFAFPFVEGLWATWVLAAAFGLFYSGDMSSILVTARMMIPARIAARSMGIGFIFDLAGSYVWSYAVAAGGGIVNLLILCGFRFVLSGGGYSRSPSILVRQ